MNYEFDDLKKIHDFMDFLKLWEMLDRAILNL